MSSMHTISATFLTKIAFKLNHETRNISADTTKIKLVPN